MNRYTKTNVWKSFDATGDNSECVEDMLGTVRYYERLARQAKWRGRFGFANRATRLSARARLRGLVHAASVTIAENFIPAACGLLAGMLGTVGLAYVVGLFL